MNSRQKIVLWVGVVLAVGMYLYAPMIAPAIPPIDYGEDAKLPGSPAHYAGYHLIWKAGDDALDASRLVVQYLLLIGVVAVGVVTAKEKT